MRDKSAFLLLFGLSSSFFACGSAPVENRFGTDGNGAPADVPATGPTLGGDQGEEDTACKKMDLVFVIDDSGSMGQEQSNLKTNFPKFLQVINKFTTKSGDAIDYRVAVTTTGVTASLQTSFGAMSQTGADGKFVKTSAMSRPWLERTDANITTLFQSIASVGTAGPSYEMPLEASRLALRERLLDNNKGFLRDDALLGIVYLTDEEDCSTTSRKITQSSTIGGHCMASQEATTKYVSFFDTLKQGRERWATAVIAGATSCTSSFGNAAEAPRLKSFVAEVGKTAVFSSICSGDLSGALTKALETFDAACQNFTAPR
jgi:hypothetical protein